MVERERLGDGAADAPRFHKSLRNANINYRNGWFFVTWQTAHNKSIFGAIVGDRCALNELGRRVEAYWRELPAKYPELELDEFVVMPNHFHAIVRIRFRPTNKEHHLGFLLGRFKGGTGYIYGKMRRAGEVEDVGDHLWQFDYWDKVVTSEQQLAAFRRYIRENQANWTRDRFGAVTQYSLGNLDLLNGPRIASSSLLTASGRAILSRKWFGGGLKSAAPIWEGRLSRSAGLQPRTTCRSYRLSRARRSARLCAARLPRAARQSRSFPRGCPSKASSRTIFSQPWPKVAFFLFRRSDPVHASTRKSPHGAMNTFFATPMRYGSATSRPTECSRR